MVYNQIMEYQNQSEIFESAPLSVGRFIEKINAQIKPINCKIIGEVSEAKPGPTGHIYFSLKDEDNGPPSTARLAQAGGAVISCAL